ncbi:MAG: MoxR family ATPase [Chloroflexi bacterium]|nr:MoxR family ATPase [Chloroflexota bacterium]
MTTELDLKRYPHGLLPLFQGEGSHGYYADSKLQKAVNLAIVLGRPLLVRGEPGIGKTALARAIAAELTDNRLIEWRIKSSDRVRDGLYQYDTIRRLIDAQVKAPDSTNSTSVQNAANPYNYVRFMYLGKAIIDPRPVVLLIDEIDKADLDFPNDLLRELDDLWFEIYEVPLPVGEYKLEAFADQQKTMSEDVLLAAARQANDPGEFAIINGQRKPRPIIVITSNDEKPLPQAFLRRCITHTIDFPTLDDSPQGEANRERLRKIVIANAKRQFNIDALRPQILERALKIFEKLREMQYAGKKPATAELIEWVVALHHPSFEALNQFADDAQLPHWPMMLKDDADIHKIGEALSDELETT